MEIQDEQEGMYIFMVIFDAFIQRNTRQILVLISNNTFSIDLGISLQGST